MRNLSWLLLVFCQVVSAKEPMVNDVLIDSKKFAVELHNVTGGELIPGVACKKPDAPTVSCMLLAEEWLTPDHDSAALGRQFYAKRPSMALHMYYALQIPAQESEIPETKEVVSVKFLSVMDPYLGEIGLICAIVVDEEGELSESLCTLFSESELKKY